MTTTLRINQVSTLDELLQYIQEIQEEIDQLHDRQNELNFQLQDVITATNSAVKLRKVAEDRLIELARTPKS